MNWEKKTKKKVHHFRHFFIRDLMVDQLVFELARSILLVEVSSFCFNNSLDKSRKSFKQFVENFRSKQETKFMYHFQKIRLICLSSLYNLRSISAQTTRLDLSREIEMANPKFQVLFTMIDNLIFLFL